MGSYPDLHVVVYITSGFLIVYTSSISPVAQVPPKGSMLHCTVILYYTKPIYNPLEICTGIAVCKYYRGLAHPEHGMAWLGDSLYRIARAGRVPSLYYMYSH